MHAEKANLITCAASECVQPGTRDIPMTVNNDGEIITLEFCDRCAERLATVVF